MKAVKDRSSFVHITIKNTMFNYHPRQKSTWTAPGQTTPDEVDYIIKKK